MAATIGKLAPALNRLLKPVADHPPVLESWERLKDGRLRLQVCGAWFPRRAYARLPLPLPLHSAMTTSLYLFLNAIRTDWMNKTDIASKSLFNRLGIASQGQAKQRLWDTIRAALKSINEHLAELDGSLKRHRLMDVVPWRYEIDAVKGARRVRFLAIPRHPDEREAVEDDLEEQRRQEAKRRRRAEHFDDDQTTDDEDEIEDQADEIEDQTDDQDEIDEIDDQTDDQIDEDEIDDQTMDDEDEIEWVHAAPVATRRLLGVVDDED